MFGPRLVAATVVLGALTSASLLSAEAAAASAPTARTPSAPQTTVTYEHGIVANCSGKAKGLDAAVELYRNSTMPDNSAVWIDGRGKQRFGAADTPNLFSRGKIAATVALETYQADDRTKYAGKAKLTGRYRVSGPAVPVDGDDYDGDEDVVVTGTNTPLDARVAVKYGHTKIKLTCTEAFVYDLKIVTTTAG